MQSIKTNQDRPGSISLLQAKKWALGCEKVVVQGQKICRACWRMLQVQRIVCVPKDGQIESLNIGCCWYLNIIFKLLIWPSFGTQTIRRTITNWPGQCSLLYHEKPSRWNQARKRYFKIEVVPKHDPHQETFKPHRTTIQRLCHYTILPWIDRKNMVLFV